MTIQHAQRTIAAYIAAEAYHEKRVDPGACVDQQPDASITATKTLSPTQPVIVVAVDGSDASQRALRWAAEEAVHRGARLTVCRAWQTSDPETQRVPGGSASAIGDRVEAELLSDIADVVASLPVDLQVTPVVVAVSAEALLVDLSNGAALLVVGHGRHDLIHELTVGLLTRHVMAHSACPIVLVP